MPNTTTYRKVIMYTTEAHKDDEITEEQLRAVENHMAHSIQTSRKFYNLPGTSRAANAHNTIDIIAKKRHFNKDEDNILIKEWPLTAEQTPSLEACRAIITISIN